MQQQKTVFIPVAMFSFYVEYSYSYLASYFIIGIKCWIWNEKVQIKVNMYMYPFLCKHIYLKYILIQIYLFTCTVVKFS